MSIGIVSARALCVPAADGDDLAGGTGNRIHTVFAPERFDCRPPFNFCSDSDSGLFAATKVTPRYAESHGAGEVFLAALENVSLATPHALVFTPDGRLIAESYHDADMADLALKEARELAARQLGESPVQRVEEPCLLLAGPWSWNYHHWLLEDVSRLWAQEAFPVLAELPIVVPAMLAPFHEESLAAFGIDPARLVHFDGGRWEFRRLLVPSFLAPGGHSRRQTAWLRAHLVAGLGIDAAASGERRLYVTRRGARARVLTNEDEVAAFLVAKGFDTVDPGALGLGEQAALFAGARVIAGASGAGLTNMLFAPPGSALIEFQPDSFVNPAHWYVTNALDQSYGFVIGKSETERHDFRISTAKLAAVLDAVPSDEFHAAPSITARSASTSARK